MDLQFLERAVERKDGRGQWLWDPFLWVLGAGAVAFIVALCFAFQHFTIPPQGH